MKEIKENTYKGTRILLGNEKRTMINSMIDILIADGYTEISIPIIQYQTIFGDKVGNENKHMMFNFQDAGNRQICLAPEYTAVIQSLKKVFKDQKDVKLFYVQECFRGETPQAGRYRQFTQLGVEILNPTKDYNDELIKLARCLISSSVTPCSVEWYKDFTEKLKINREAKRGLDYYKEGKGFEIAYDDLGAQKQICGGGEYDGGVGFALGIDRIILIK